MVLRLGAPYVRLVEVLEVAASLLAGLAVELVRGPRSVQRSWPLLRVSQLILSADFELLDSARSDLAGS